MLVDANIATGPSWPLEGGHFVLAINVMLCSQDYFLASQIAISFVSHLRSKALFGIGNHYSRNTKSAKIILDLVKKKKKIIWPEQLVPGPPPHVFKDQF